MANSIMTKDTTRHCAGSATFSKEEQKISVSEKAIKRIRNGYLRYLEGLMADNGEIFVFKHRGEG